MKRDIIYLKKCCLSSLLKFFIKLKIILKFWKSNLKFLLFILFCFVVIKFIKNIKKFIDNDKSFITRQFVILPYFAVWIILSKKYYKSVLKVCKTNQVIVNRLKKILNLAIKLSSKKYYKFILILSLLSFYIGFKKIGKNWIFSRFVRYHYLLAAMYSGAFFSMSHFLTFCSNYNLISNFRLKWIETLFYIWASFWLVYSALCGIFGRETKNFNFMIMAVQSHLPRK